MGKGKRVSKVARGRFSKALVLRGSKEKTGGGLKKDDLFKNKRGKIVPKRASAAAKTTLQAYRRLGRISCSSSRVAPRARLRCNQWQDVAGQGSVCKEQGSVHGEQKHFPHCRAL